MCLAALLGWTASAESARAMWPYRVAPTRACLEAAGVDIEPPNIAPAYPKLELGAIAWLLVAGTTDQIIITFAKDPRHASALVTDFRQEDRVLGDTAEQARRYIVLKGNAVFFADYIPWHLTARARSIITGCLRP